MSIKPESKSHTGDGIQSLVTLTIGMTSLIMPPITLLAFFEGSSYTLAYAGFTLFLLFVVWVTSRKSNNER